MIEWRRLARAAGIAAAVALAGAGASAKDEEGDDKSAEWQKLSACAAAYRVNAKGKDPSRAADMAKSMAGVADDYENAANRSRRQERGGGVSGARQAVRDLVSANMRTFAGKPRADVEAFIEACPQIEAQ